MPRRCLEMDTVGALPMADARRLPYPGYEWDKACIRRNFMVQSSQEPGRDPDIGTPAWVKALGALVAVVVVLFIILHLTGHAPMGHGG